MEDALGRRALAGAVFVVVVTGLAYLGGVAFLFLTLLVIGLGLVEFYRLAGGCGAQPAAGPGVLLGLAVAVCSYLLGAGGLLASTALAVAVILVFVGHGTSGERLRDAAVTLAGVLYVGFLGAHMVLLRESSRGPGRDYADGFAAIMAALAATWCCDTVAYLVGRSFGRHKLVPSVSPGKSWEGTVAGLGGAVLGLLLVEVILGGPVRWPASMALGLAAGTAAVAGDLAESMLKRQAGVKDSSNLIPGHGGVLDRFDGLLFAAPVVYYYVASTSIAGVP